MKCESQVNLLILDDDSQFSEMLSRYTHQLGCHTICRYDLNEGIAAARENDVDVVLLDVNLPDGNGLDVLPTLKQMPRQPDVIIMTGFGELCGAETAIDKGAWDYIPKNGSHQKIISTLNRVLEYRTHHRRSQAPSSIPVIDLDGIIFKSDTMERCIDQVAKAAQSPANTLITGATGTGKEVFARAIHRNSQRCQANMVVVDCAALPETLVESMLFGHIRGAYTGADKGRDGLVAQADGGTLFLDEVGEMPLSIQKVFLRVLQERRFRPVGSSREVPSDFRLIAATNRNLDEMAEEGLFREDLLYRIRTLQIGLPPLKARKSDIEPLSRYYLDKICDRHGIEPKSVSPDFFEAMAYHQWPGNVRELINTLETVVSANRCESVLFARHLPSHIRLEAIHSALDGQAHKDMNVFTEAGKSDSRRLPSLKRFRKSAIARVEKEYLELLMDSAPCDVKTALKISGLSKSRFYELIKQHGLAYSTS